MREIRFTTRLLAASALSLCLAACGAETGERFNSKKFGDGDALFIDASQRGVFAAEAKTQSVVNQGRVPAGRIICAEPSPDIAVAVASSLQTALNLSVGTAKVDAAGAFSMSRQVAEALAQLGKRTSTIQAMRESLYRMCQDYSNGLVTDVMYAMFLSRFGDTLVTLFAIETTTGSDIGTGGAQVTTAANSNINQSAVAAAEEQIAKAKGELGKKSAELQKLQGELKGIDKTKDATGYEQKSKEVGTAEAEKTDALRQVNEAQKDLVRLATAGATLRTATETAAAASGRPDPAVAAIIADIQRTYSSDGATGALLVGCSVALDRQGVSIAGAAQQKIEAVRTKAAAIEAARSALLTAKPSEKTQLQNALKTASTQLAGAWAEYAQSAGLNPYQLMCLTEVMPRAARIIDADRQAKENSFSVPMQQARLVSGLAKASRKAVGDTVEALSGLAASTPNAEQKKQLQEIIAKLKKA